GFQDPRGGKSQVEPVRVVVGPDPEIGGKLVFDVLLCRQLGVDLELVQLRIANVQHLGTGLEAKTQFSVPGNRYGIGKINAEIGFRSRPYSVVHDGKSQAHSTVAHRTVQVEGLGLRGPI